MICTSCGSANPVGFRFCGSCGTALSRACPACGMAVAEGARFCGACGQAQEVAAETQALPSAAANAMPSERRRVTVLFADLVGFATLAEHMDPEALRTLMGGTFAELRAEVEAREGVVEKFIGDAVVAIFGAPHTHEDDPERAVATALAMLERVHALAQGLELRVGINSGLVVSGAVGDGSQAGVMGDAVNTAARLQQAAGPGEVLVSAPVWRRIRDSYQTEPVGNLTVKGRDQAVEAHRVLGISPAAARRQAPFVGRREELALLELLWSSAAKGNSHVVSLIGEPGAGKSRLLAQFSVPGEAVDLRVACSGERAYGPFLDLIAQILGGLPQSVDELRERTLALGVDEESALLLSALLGLGGAPPSARMADEQKKRQVFAGVWQFLLKALAGRPTLLVFDDLHWADRSSLDLMGFLLEHVAGVPIMFVVAYRPGFDEVERTALRASHTGIRLERLSVEESSALARGYLGVTELPADLARVVTGRAEGNPFFIEELLQALLELGSLEVIEGMAVLTQVDLEVPDTVQGTIQARVDRLQEAERAALQYAAVIGRSFSADLIARVMAPADPLPALEALARSQLLVAASPGEWSFKHALIQEVVYEALLLRQRRDLHLKVAQALEELATDDPSQMEILAEHYSRAEAPEKARRYALAAGDLAQQRQGFAEAAIRYETALRLWGTGDERGRLALLTKLGYTSLWGGDAARARSCLIEAADDWEALGEVSEAGSCLALLGRVHWVNGESERSFEVLGRAIAMLDPLGPTPELVRALHWASTGHMLQGEALEGAILARRGLAMARSLGLPAAHANLLNTLGICETSMGDVGGLDRLREAVLLAEESADVEALGRGYCNLASVLGNFGQNREAVEVAEIGRRRMLALGAPGFLWFIAANQSWSLMQLGEYAESERLSREIFEHRQVMGVPGMANVSATRSAVLLRTGRPDEARRLMDDVLPAARGLGGAEFLMPLLALDAQLEALRGNQAAARQTTREAIDLVAAVPSIVHAALLLPQAVRLVPAADCEALLDRVRGFSEHPGMRARELEAQGVMERDDELLHEAAELYASLELPYEEAQCRIDAGELERARELIDRYGLGDGPLGARLRELEAPAP